MNRWWKRTFSVVAASSMLAACGGQATQAIDGNDVGGDGKFDAIGSGERPEVLVPGASNLLSQVISASDVGQTFGTDDEHVPYPDTYWPFVDEGIDARWNGEEKSPLEKLVSLYASPEQLELAKSWEKANHGSGVPGVEGWFGHCPGWTGASMDNAPIQHAVYARYDGANMVACSEGEEGCTKFEIGDLDALMAEVYVDGDAGFIGARCDTSHEDIKFDAAGRVVTRGCGGINPGSLLIVANELMKNQKKPFAIDAQNDNNTDEIWNQPAYRYTVNRYETLTEAQAVNLVKSGKRDGDLTSYAKINAKAKGFALIDLTLHWVTEHGPNLRPYSGLQSTRKTRVVAVIELDRAATDRNAHIIGGEYLDDKDVRATKLTVPPFLWTTKGPGPELPLDEISADPAESQYYGHNPYVLSSLVQQLIALGQK